jgi:hypothetical protein
VTENKVRVAIKNARKTVVKRLLKLNKISGVSGPLQAN